MIFRLLFISTAVAYLAACQTNQPTWYEQRCIEIGFEPGSPEFQACTERDRRWMHRQGGGP